MAENTIDNLSIQVVASAEKAISVFNRLASGASGLKSAALGVAGGMQDMAQGAKDAGSATQQAGTQSGKARPNIKGVGKDAKDAGENAKKGSSGLDTFWQSLKRIAYYRMIRSIIKAISQAFKEGAQNLYQWSAANPSLSDFAKNMDRIATSVLYLKNSLGALLEPIVRILTPVIEWVVDKLVWLIDKVNQFFAALSGAETYTAAKKVAQTWGDTSQQVANNTHKAAEEIKRTILGFDEINKLDKPNSGSYGGGSGLPSASAAAQDMFEERPLEGWAKTISDFIRTIASWIDSIFGPIKQLFSDTGDAFDNLNRSLDAAQQEDKTVNINVKINTTAEKLWNDFVDEWDAIKDRILFFKISPTPPVDLLWNQIKNVWDSVDHTLGFLIETASSADGHWNVFKKEWDAGNRIVGFIIKTASSANGHWDVFKKEWDAGDRIVGFIIKTASSADGHWDVFKKEWDAGDRTVYVDVQLKKKDWTTVTEFVDDSFGGATGGGGKNSGGGAGRSRSSTYNIPVDVAPAWASTVGGLIPYLKINDLFTTITAKAKKGWKSKTFKGAVGASDTSSTITANLSKGWGGQKPLDYLKLSGLTAVIKTKLEKTEGNKATYSFSGGGTDKNVKAFELSKNGAVFVNGVRHNIPQYANGTTNAHGSLFLAGEAGPEIVGHVGGRTEVLNKSQLASAMYSAVQAAMAPAAANFAAAAQSFGVADAGVDMETLAEMIRQGVEQAMARSNDYDRQKVALLQQINDKDYSPEISTSSINKAQQRMNRRAGTTIVPVGT